jgi:hypothetical protein
VSWSMHVSGLQGLRAIMPHRARCLASRRLASCRKNSPVCSSIRYPLEHQCCHAIGRSVTWSRRKYSVLVPLSWHYLALVMGSQILSYFMSYVCDSASLYVALRFSDCRRPCHIQKCVVLTCSPRTNKLYEQTPSER